jgi:hypothetical protein
MELDSEALILAVIPIVIGFLLGILSQPLAQMVINRRRRNRLAQALKSEIRAIRLAVDSRLRIHRESIDASEREFKASPNVIGGPEMADGPLPTGVYSSNTNNLGLFNDDIIVLLTELYNWIGYANHHRDLNMQEARDLQSVYVPLLDKEIEDATMAYARLKSGTMIHYAKAYMKSLEKIQALAEDSLKELVKISSGESKYSVSASFGEPLKDNFP